MNDPLFSIEESPGFPGKNVMCVTTQPQEVISSQVMQVLADDMDKKIRIALIEMGWTPPDDAA